MKKITVLIPCHNEADAIGSVMARFPRERIKSAGFELEIIVIDNNSTDDTTRIAEAAGATVISELRQGKGNAVKTGFYAISEDTDYVVMLDGDDTYYPEEILRLVEPLDSGFASVIIGSRLHGDIQAGSMKRFNRFGNQTYSRMVQSAYKVKVTDVLTGYFAWTRQAVEAIRPEIRSAGFAIEMEMITKLARMGFKIYSVPVSYNSRLGDSSLRPIRDGMTILRTYTGNLRWQPNSISVGQEISARRPKSRVKLATLKLSSAKDKARHEATENSLSL
jgi:glycosyltransferase involved in cell wall biosynthesis